MNPSSPKKLFLLLFCCVFFVAVVGPKVDPLYAQNNNSDYRTLFTDAEYYFLFNDFQEALPLYLKALDRQPNNANVLYRIGQCYLNSPGQKHKAIQFLNLASKNINLSYQEGSYKETGASKNVFFFLGEAYRANGFLDEAIAAYTTFKESISPREYADLEFVTQQIEACQRAKLMMDNELHVTSQDLMLIDDQSYILTPAISADGKFMLFTRQEKFYDAIYIAEKNSEGEWGTPINITLDLAIEGSAYSTSINSDGTQLFLFKDDRGIGNIYTAEKVDGKWEKAQKLGRPINTRSWETFASISPDGQTLYFSSHRNGGQGGLDLYYSSLKPDGTWDEAINLGETINTPFNEEAPYLTPDGKTLFFISQGHNSIGGYDIFYTEKIGENEWSTPTNLGYPINTTDDDMTFFPLAKNEGLVARVVKDNPNVRLVKHVTISSKPKVKDIMLAGVVTLDDNSQIAADAVNVSISNTETNEVLAQLTAEAESGKFNTILNPGSYSVTISSASYTSKEAVVIIPESYVQSEFPVVVNLVPEEVTTGQLYAINFILFDFDKYILKREALFELEKLFTFLVDNPSIIVEVAGHTDSKGNATYNIELSKKRAQEAINYLTEKGIDKSRLMLRAAGPFESIAANLKADGTDNPEGRKFNRRVSIRVLKSDENIIITDEVAIPDHLLPFSQNYTILLAPVGQEVDEKHLKEIQQFAKTEPKKVIGTMGLWAYTIGEFENKANALNLLNYAIDNHFPQAAIVGLNDLNLLIARIIEDLALVKDGKYSIQLLTSSPDRLPPSTFKGLNVVEQKTSLGYDYTYGVFDNQRQAKQELKAVKNLGFSNAFIFKTTP